MSACDVTRTLLAVDAVHVQVSGSHVDKAGLGGQQCMDCLRRWCLRPVVRRQDFVCQLHAQPESMSDQNPG